MRKGFTILEMLVASLLLGMLMTILTMIFTQSSIAWRTGVAGISDLDTVRKGIGRVRVEADNAYILPSSSPQVHSILSVWKPEGGAGASRLRQRAIDADGVTVAESERIKAIAGYLRTDDNVSKAGEHTLLINAANAASSAGVGGSGGNADKTTYTVNVRCSGPNRNPDDWDDIWSFPDDFDM